MRVTEATPGGRGEIPSELSATLSVPDGFLLLGGPGKRGWGWSNVTFRQANDGEVRVLKVYRRRKARVRELFARFSHSFLEGKRGPSAQARRETERLSLALWARHGLRTPRVLDLDPPAWVGGAPCLWLSFVPGRVLFWVLSDPTVDEELKERLVQTLAREDQRRHRLALELGEPLLLHEHPTTKHTLVVGDRDLVTIDLEGGYQAGYPVPLAVSHDLTGVIRSLWRDPESPCFRERLPQVYVEAYGDDDQLRALCRAGVGGSPRSRFKTWNDRWRGRRRSKTAVLVELRSRLG